MNVLVLGAGVQGRVVAHALERRNAAVRLADLAPPPGGMVLDARDADAVASAARGCDVAVTSRGYARALGPPCRDRLTGRATRAIVEAQPMVE
jgi:nucleoside-diphosphate-sugar epimerase